MVQATAPVHACSEGMVGRPRGAGLLGFEVAGRHVEACREHAQDAVSDLVPVLTRRGVRRARSETRHTGAAVFGSARCFTISAVTSSSSPLNRQSKTSERVGGSPTGRCT